MSKGTHTREAIVQEAMRTASQIGLEGLSIGQLAGQLGLSKSGLFAHFKSKENLQIQVLEGSAQLFIQRVVLPALDEPRGEPRVRALFENWLGWASRPALPGGCIFVGAATEFDDRPGPVRAHLVSTQRDWVATLGRAARIAQDEGHFRADLDAEQFAYHIYSLLLGGHLYNRLLEDGRALERARAGFDLLLRDARAR